MFFDKGSPSLDGWMDRRRMNFGECELKEYWMEEHNILCIITLSLIINGVCWIERKRTGYTF